MGKWPGIFNISTKTLRHYETIGLYSPVKTGGDNQYRYYGLGQLTELRRIVWLRSIGVSIDKIRALKMDGSLQADGTIGLMLEEHSEAIRKELDRQKRMLSSVERMKAHLNQPGGAGMEPKVVTKKSFTIIGSRWSNRQLKDGFGIPKHWEQFMPRAHEITDKVNANECYGIGMPQESGEFAYIAGFETQSAQIPEGMTAITVPEQTYAVFTHTGITAHLWATKDQIYSKLLPQHRLIPANEICYELYDYRFQGGNNPDSQFDLYIPLSEKQSSS